MRSEDEQSSTGSSTPMDLSEQDDVLIAVDVQGIVDQAKEFLEDSFEAGDRDGTHGSGKPASGTSISGEALFERSDEILSESCESGGVGPSAGESGDEEDVAQELDALIDEIAAVGLWEPAAAVPKPPPPPPVAREAAETEPAPPPSEPSTPSPSPPPEALPAAPGRVVFAGPLMKVGGKVLRRWQRRHFVLTAEWLAWFEDEADARGEREPQNFISISQIAGVHAETDRRGTPLVKVLMCDGYKKAAYTLSAPSTRVRDEFHAALAKIIK